MADLQKRLTGFIYTDFNYINQKYSYTGIFGKCKVSTKTKFAL
jgi:hypothetical protein